MGQKGNLAVFESSCISEEVTPTKIGVHVSVLDDFFEPILSN